MPSTLPGRSILTPTASESQVEGSTLALMRDPWGTASEDLAFEDPTSENHVAGDQAAATAHSSPDAGPTVPVHTAGSEGPPTSDDDVTTGHPAPAEPVLDVRLPLELDVRPTSGRTALDRLFEGEADPVGPSPEPATIPSPSPEAHDA